MNAKHPRANRPTEKRCYQKLFELFYRQGLRCPQCGQGEGLHVCRGHKDSAVPDYRCQRCGCVFNAWTGTPLQGTHHRPSELWRFVQGLRRGEATSSLAAELGCQRRPLALLRRKLQPMLTQAYGPPPKKSALRKARKKNQKRRSPKR
jgi:transposase-like protein